LPSSFFVLRAFHPQPVEQRAPGLLLAGGDFDQAVNEMGATWPGTFSIVIGPTYGLTRLLTRLRLRGLPKFAVWSPSLTATTPGQGYGLMSPFATACSVAAVINALNMGR
jgi:hypothetical protein